MKVALKNYEHPLFATKCATGYWISYEYGKFLKDDSGKLKVFTQSEIDEFHELYKQEFRLQYEQEQAAKQAKENGLNGLMFSAKLDDHDAMSVLKQVFSVSSMEENDFDPDKLQERLNNVISKRI